MLLSGVTMKMSHMLPMPLCKAWIIVLYVCQFWIYATDATAKLQQDEFLKRLETFEITIPSRVTRDGHHVAYNLHPGHTVRRRSVDSVHQFEQDDIHYKVNIENIDIVLQLKPNYNLLSPSFVIERKKFIFKNVSDSTFHRLNTTLRNCHYHGNIVNQSSSKVAVGVCEGLHGFIHTDTDQYFIEPIVGGVSDGTALHRHVVYKRSALPAHLDPLSTHHVHKRGVEEDDSCGVKDTFTATKRRKRWEAHHRRKRKSSRRTKRSISTERYAETLVVVDPKMASYHESERLDTYVLTIMNMVATMFHDATIGNSINMVLVRIMILEDHENDLVITHHADKTLTSFCKYQKSINFKDDDHPNHHDVAILLTRHNICSRLDEPCSTLGLAQVSGMCQPHRSCNINEDTGLALAYTVTHELGHNFGMHHDGSANGCEDPPGKQLYIMSPSLIADSLSKSWSNCSKHAITTFIDRDWGYCLDDEPADHEYDFPVLPAGTMYDANHQCRLQYGTDQTEICTNQQDVCTNLWCKVDNRCSTHLEAAAEGTICGDNQWCYEGQCVKIGDRPEAINGEWGEWSGWSGCTRTCGAGVSHSQRHCDNPQPSHGGKYCLGERKRHRICNTEDCDESAPSFNTVQCQEFNYIPYKKGIYEWEYVPTHETPCQLHCKPTRQFFSVLLKDIVTDGTPCTPGTRNMCISGRCTHVGCDYVIDSKAHEDRCGICHGDGSTCTTVKSNYTKSQGLGYVEAAVIPTGARNIRVEEVAAANNFLALQNDVGEYYLNGHWFIQWSGDYKAAGTIIQYERVDNKETFSSPGPLKEPLHVMLLLQSENPGLLFEYTVPKDNISEARVLEFHWSYQTWTHCTASCGGGTQRSEVVCTEIEAGVVDHKYCDEQTKPDDKQKVCNDHQCPARWWSGPWQHCSVTCGNDGVHHRTVICVRSLGPDEQIALDDEACETDEKPAEVEACHKKEACPGLSAWVVSDWSSCNGNACGIKYRTATCDNPSIGCQETPIPASEMSCREDVTCGSWVTHEWMECTRTCGDGIQYRKVTCQDGDACNTLTEPTSQKNCNNNPCPILGPETTSVGNDEPVTTLLPITETNITIKSNHPTRVDESNAGIIPPEVTEDTNSSSSVMNVEAVVDETESNTDNFNDSINSNKDTSVLQILDESDNNPYTGSRDIETSHSEVENVSKASNNSIIKPTEASINIVDLTKKPPYGSGPLEDNVKADRDNSILNKNKESETTSPVSDNKTSSENIVTPTREAVYNDTETTTTVTNDNKGNHKHRHHHGEHPNRIINNDTESINMETGINIPDEVKISGGNNTQDMIIKAVEDKNRSSKLTEDDIKEHTTARMQDSVLHNDNPPLVDSKSDNDSKISASNNAFPGSSHDSESTHDSNDGNTDATILDGSNTLATQLTKDNEKDHNNVKLQHISSKPDWSVANSSSPLPTQKTTISPKVHPSLADVEPPSKDTLPLLPNQKDEHSLPDRDVILPSTDKKQSPSLGVDIHSPLDEMPPLQSNTDSATPVNMNKTSELAEQVGSDAQELSPNNNISPQSSVNKLPSLTDSEDEHNMDKLPPQPNTDMLPQLPDINKLAPLSVPKSISSIEVLPPLPGTVDLSSLPSMNNLPPLPDHEGVHHIEDMPPLPNKADLSPLADIDKLKTLPDPELPPLEDLPPLPNKDDLAPLPDKLEPLPDQDVPPLEDLPSLPSKNELPALPTMDQLPTLSNMDKLSPLPDMNKLAHLPDMDSKMSNMENLPKLPDPRDLHPLPDINKLPHQNPGFSDNNLNSKMLQNTNVPEKRSHYWEPSSWTECSRLCGDSGVRTRSVACIDSDTAMEAGETSCDIQYKPTAIEECNRRQCLPWQTSTWSQCSATCGYSVRSRQVICPDKMGSCNPDDQPARTEGCDVPKCVTWVSGQWSQCTKTCGKGEQFRLVQCVNLTSQHSARGCDSLTKPAEKNSCSEDPCPVQKAAALTIRCEHNEMSYIVCRALKRMNQCHRRFVSLKCCKTCGKAALRKHRTRAHSNR